MGTKLYVGNLPYAASDEDLGNLFSQVGSVTSARILFDRETGRSKGFGFVEMSSEQEVQEAISRFAGFNFMGRPLTVNEARPQEPRAGGPGPRRDRGPRRY